MTFHDCIQPYSSHKSTVFGMQQKLSRRKQTDLPGGNQLWLAAAKISSCIFAGMLVVSILLGSYSASLQRRIDTVEQKAADLSNANVALLTERAMLVKQFRKPVQDSESVAIQESPDNHIIKFNRKIR